ncbi:MAG: RelA/SpoT family protein, partial [Prevotellaceae bacterium]|nr:RelA/SpoT family protein [Prevotellaceae bacterium]
MADENIDREEAQQAFDSMLKSALRSFTADEVEAMRKAFSLAYEAHKGTRRKSGEAYIMHPIAVARIVAHEIGLGYKSIAAALLHDVVEDTEYTTEDIRGMFGEKISFFVDGLTKLDNIFDGQVSIQAENFKKMMLAMADDIRVVLIKLADRLHNMRTLGSMAPHKQEKIASETVYLYAPLAHRLGLYNIKTELEDLTMKFQFPKVYEELQSKIAATAAERNAYIDQFIAPIKERLKDNSIDFDIKGRVKSVYSIWKKMENKQIPFEEIYDLFAVRVVFKPAPDADEKRQCWQIYSMVTDIYRPNYNRLRDWLTAPKDNGYEALHITVMGPKGRWVELQIRSERMNEIAERGYAAHWRYKENEVQGEEKNSDSFDKELDIWLARIREMLINNEENAIEFLDQFKLNTFAENITVYSPKGKVVKLPKKATALDFAYEIHTEIGNKAIGAKVNHKLVPLSYVLSSGDQVEMLTADNQKPQVEWLNFATTSRARYQIKAALKAEVKEHFQKGKHVVEEALRHAGAQPNAKLYKRITDAYHVTNKQELFSQIGAGILQLTEIERIVRKSRRNKFLRYMELQILGTGKRKRTDEAAEKPKEETIDKKAFLLKEGTDPSKLAYRIASCCSPIPGDSVIGFLESNNKVLIHKKSCPIAIREAAQHGEKIVNAKWTEHKTLSFLARIAINGFDRMGMTQELLKIISGEMKINIRRINAESH